MTGVGSHTEQVSTPLTPIIGREREIAEIISLLVNPDVRLVVLTGPGGIGKTRLSIEVAHRNGDWFADGATFVSLSAVRDPAGLFPAIAAELSLHQPGIHPLPERLANEIGDREMLLVLDNFEHIVSAGTELIDLLSHCPRLTVLVTSRALLRVTGEFVYPVSPLRWNQSSTSSELPDAMQLFVERANAVVPGFKVDEETQKQVTRICQLLDGLPLGIELAASRLRHLPLDALRERLDSQLSILRGGPRNLPDRLQTMRNAISWSYDLLEPGEQALFRRLSVFPGGFRLDAAAWMHGEGDEDAAMDGLSVLIDNSMVSLSPEPDGTPRYRMLEPIREFGLEQLECLDDSDALHQRMADWCSDLAVRGRASLNRRVNDLHWLRRYDVELDNLRRSLAWLESAGQGDGMLKNAVSLGWYWYSRALLREGGAWIDRALTISSTDQVSASLRGWGLFWLGIIVESQGESDRSHALMLAARSQFRELGDKRCETVANANLGTIAVQSGDLMNASVYLNEALAYLQEDPGQNLATQSFVYFQLGMVSRAFEDFDQATKHFQHAFDISQSARDHWTLAASLLGLGLCSRERGDYEIAAKQLQTALRECLVVGTTSSEAAMATLGALATIMVACGETTSGTKLFGFEQHVRALIDTPRKSQARTYIQRYEVQAKEWLGEDQFERAWRDGEELSVEQALELAWSFIPESQRLAPERGSSSEYRTPNRLTPRELQVLELVADGLTNPEIGERLFISRGTVRIHVSSILGKLGASNRIEAVGLARRQGMLE